jgi:hypothetical protein
VEYSQLGGILRFSAGPVCGLVDRDSSLLQQLRQKVQFGGDAWDLDHATRLF